MVAEGIGMGSASYRRIHMPLGLYREIQSYAEKRGLAVDEVCREAVRVLIERHQLRERYG